MSISVTSPVSVAIERTKQILFRPFDASKWFGLGFCAWLAYLGQGGGGGGNYNPNLGGNRSRGFPQIGGGGSGGTGSGAPEMPKEFQEIGNWMQANIALLVLIAAGAFLFIFALGLVLSWLQCRGQFMFIDGIVKNRGAVREPWSEYRLEGNSLFKFNFVVGLISLAVTLPLVGICVLVAWPDIRSETFGTYAMSAILLFIVPMVVLSLGFWAMHFLLMDFVVPAMYLRRVTVMQGWRIVGAAFGGYKGTIILYFFFQILLAIGIAFCTFIGTCLMCCLPALPYLGTVMLLPLFVFSRAYTLAFLEQFGAEWRFFSEVGGESGEDVQGGVEQ